MAYSDVNLVVGCGVSGAVIANLLASVADEKVLVIDKKIILQAIVMIIVMKTGL